MSLDVLAFGPHPDDVELFCGGTLLRLRELGYSTGVVDLSKGERASNGTVEEREAECVEASRILGLSHRENLALPDTLIGVEGAEGLSVDSQLSRIVECIRRLQPEIVLIPWLEERHPDHVAAGHLLTRALFFAGVGGFPTEPSQPRFRPRQVLHYALRYRFTPTFILDTSSVAEKKAAAIACYSSQMVKSPGGVETLIASGRAASAIEARDRYYGSMIGVSHGEALKMANTPGLFDPVRFFRENPFSEAHAFEPLA